MRKISIKYFVLSSGAIGLFIFLIFLIANFITAALIPDLIGRIFTLLISGLVAGLAITLMLSWLSPIFTDWIIILRKLLRYDSLSHPLIQRLSYEAPGTYHHSINVSNLGQEAAKSISCDALLVRIAAYYHDIGKLTAPLRFVENQAGYEIPHNLQAEAIQKNVNEIIDHVRDGVAIARSYDLPESIVNMIKEHHGTTKVVYFFELAKEKGLKIKKTDFKYAGPVPQTKESAILMLADSIEAATRALPELNDQNVDQIIKNVFSDKITEGQFKLCRLSERELSKLKRSFSMTIKSIYHQRIAYNSILNEQS